MNAGEAPADRVDGGPGRQVRDVAVATVVKFSRDRSARLAAGIAFWAFFAVFPLLLVLVSLLGFFLPDSTRSEVMHNVAALFPLIDPDNVGGLKGSVWSIVAGTATALWCGTQLMRSAEFAFNSAWGIPEVERPRIAEQMRRALLTLSTIGLGLVVSALLSGLVTGRSSDVHLGAAGKGFGYVVSAILDVGLFLLAFRILTDRRITFRQVIPGAVLSGMSFGLLEFVSSARHLAPPAGRGAHLRSLCDRHHDPLVVLPAGSYNAPWLPAQRRPASPERPAWAIEPPGPCRVGPREAAVVVEHVSGSSVWVAVEPHRDDEAGKEMLFRFGPLVIPDAAEHCPPRSLPFDLPS